MADSLGTITADNEVHFKTLEDGRIEISIITDKSSRYRLMQMLEEVRLWGKEITVTFEKHRRKRSLTANKYLWILIHEVAAEKHVPDEELYREYIRDAGLKKTDELPDEFYKTVSYVWSCRGLGWFSERRDNGSREGYSQYTFYYGSSCYNSKQMARLIDAVLQDCEAGGIETMPRKEIDSLVNSWRGKL